MSPCTRWMRAYMDALNEGRQVVLVRWTKPMLEVQRGEVKASTPMWWNKN